MAVSVVVPCGECGAKLRLSVDRLAKKIKCPKCGGIVNSRKDKGEGDPAQASGGKWPIVLAFLLLVAVGGGLAYTFIPSRATDPELVEADEPIPAGKAPTFSKAALGKIVPDETTLVELQKLFGPGQKVGEQHLRDVTEIERGQNVGPIQDFQAAGYGEARDWTNGKDHFVVILKSGTNKVLEAMWISTEGGNRVMRVKNAAATKDYNLTEIRKKGRG